MSETTTPNSTNTEGANTPADNKGNQGDNPQGEQQTAKPDAKFTQVDMDKAVEARLARERKKFEQTLQEKLAEHERLAKLGEEERLAEQKRQEEAAIKQRELDITLKENLFDARNTLIEKGIAHELAELVVDANTEVMEQNIKKLEVQFGKAVEAAVAERLKGKTPAAPSTTQSEGVQKYGRQTVL